jgi:hypothetical protein
MSAPGDRLPWLAKLPRRPLCPVPWEGNTVVGSDGQVLLCCFSDAVVGNVRDEPFERIWNGKTMQRIRRTLVAGALPPECRSGSCPFFRGDSLHYLLDRRDGAFRNGGAEQAQAVASARLVGSRLAMPSRVRRGERLRAELELRYEGEAARADLFVCLQRGDGTPRFLPHDLEFPAPFAAGITIGSPGASWTVLDETAAAPLGGTVTLSAALFVPDSDPNLPQHCYWSIAASCEIED